MHNPGLKSLAPAAPALHALLKWPRPGDIGLNWTAILHAPVAILKRVSTLVPEFSLSLRRSGELREQEYFVDEWHGALPVSPLMWKRHSALLVCAARVRSAHARARAAAKTADAESGTFVEHRDAFAPISMDIANFSRRPVWASNQGDAWLIREELSSAARDVQAHAAPDFAAIIEQGFDRAA